MITRKDLVTSLHCHCCNEGLQESELNYYYDYDGMCQNCFEVSMHAAYENDWLEEHELLRLVEDED